MSRRNHVARPAIYLRATIFRYIAEFVCKQITRHHSQLFATRGSRLRNPQFLSSLFQSPLNCYVPCVPSKTHTQRFIKFSNNASDELMEIGINPHCPFKQLERQPRARIISILINRFIRDITYLFIEKRRKSASQRRHETSSRSYFNVLTEISPLLSGTKIQRQILRLQVYRKWVREPMANTRNNGKMCRVQWKIDTTACIKGEIRNLIHTSQTASRLLGGSRVWQNKKKRKRRKSEGETQTRGD